MHSQLSRVSFPDGIFFQENPLQLMGYLLLNMPQWAIDIKPQMQGDQWVLASAKSSVDQVYELYELELIIPNYIFNAL